ncbi:YqjF family protein [Euzebya tangerina]|uniref:YqjF family protein n=1 Tax=Euzebya tangerina TaxID=591198 RepID=UPI000E30FEED|nr:DUF2071 domain-containing protein [Euzebya tangerina]
MPVRYPDASPHVIGQPAVTQVWEDITMLHWRVDPGHLQTLLPDGVVPDIADGSAWASLVPFRMTRLTAPPLPPLPYVGRFCETNIRTYVDGPDGPAVWFFSLDIPVLAGLPVARLVFGQPYTWSRMGMRRRGEEIRYICRRRYPTAEHGDVPRPRSRVGVRLGSALDLDDVDRFLLNRWGAYSVIRGRLHHAPVAHDPWPVRAATITVLDDQLAAAAGVPISTVERVHYASAARGVSFDWPQPSG